ncbi:Na+-transporting methylmalonyl-CoA/oxaloacetate decarboxylase, beta subunit, partial [Anaerococcus hydrogenalis]
MRNEIDQVSPDFDDEVSIVRRAATSSCGTRFQPWQRICPADQTAIGHWQRAEISAPFRRKERGQLGSFAADFMVAIASVWHDSGMVAFSLGHGLMIFVGILLLYMAFVKEYEPLLLGPIAFGCILANLPKNGFEEGVFALISAGIHYEIFPPLIFMGVGAMTDFGPLLANPKTLLLGAA